jgi:hypothetical protein
MAPMAGGLIELGQMRNAGELRLKFRSGCTRSSWLEDPMAHTKFMSQIVLNAQVAAAEHVRDCDKCRHLFEIAYEEVDSEWGLGPNPFFVMTQILEDLRRCPDWPRSI